MFTRSRYQQMRVIDASLNRYYTAARLQGCGCCNVCCALSRNAFSVSPTAARTGARPRAYFAIFFRAAPAPSTLRVPAGPTTTATESLCRPHSTKATFSQNITDPLLKNGVFRPLPLRHFNQSMLYSLNDELVQIVCTPEFCESLQVTRDEINPQTPRTLARMKMVRSDGLDLYSVKNNTVLISVFSCP